MKRNNKKILIILTASLVALVLIIGGLFYLQSFKTVHFDIKKDEVNIAVYKGDAKVEQNKQATLEASGDLRLQAGKYTAFPEGGKYDTTGIGFTVKDSLTVTIDPDYSEIYRVELRFIELPVITQVIRSAYPNAISGFRMAKGTIFKEGQWYGTTLIQNTDSPSEQGDTYRTILKKEGGVWKIMAAPALILSAKDYPDIPFELLDNVNKMEWKP